MKVCILLFPLSFFQYFKDVSPVSSSLYGFKREICYHLCHCSSVCIYGPVCSGCISLSLVLRNLIVTCHSVVFFVFLVLELLKFSDLWVTFSSNFRNSQPLLLQLFFCPLPYFLLQRFQLYLSLATSSCPSVH